MDEKMRAVLRLGDEVAAELEDARDMLRHRRQHAVLGVDDVVEAQLEPLVLAIGAESGRLGPAGVEDREDVAHPGLAEALELLDAAYRDAEPGECLDLAHCASLR